MQYFDKYLNESSNQQSALSENTWIIWEFLNSVALWQWLHPQHHINFEFNFDLAFLYCLFIYFRTKNQPAKHGRRYSKIKNEINEIVFGVRCVRFVYFYSIYILWYRLFWILCGHFVLVPWNLTLLTYIALLLKPHFILYYYKRFRVN